MKKLSVCAFSFLLFLAVCIIFSCSGLSGSFNQDVHEYFDMMTNTAAIEKHDIPVATQTGSGGRLCISSADGPVTVSYYLRNPKLFSFTDGQNLNYGLTDSDAQSVADGLGDESVSVKQNEADYSVITVKYSIDFLREMDGKLNTDGNYCSITESVNIKHPYSLEDFGTYSFPLYCNSTPPLMQGGVCLADSNSKAVLFMRLPNQDSLRYIHKDLAYIKINGSSFPIRSRDDSGNATGDVEFTGSTDLKASGTITVNSSTGNVSYNSATYTRFGTSTAVYSAGNNGTDLFYETNENLAVGKTYKVELVDKMGFTSAIVIDASANQIGEVTYENTEGKIVKYTDSEGTPHTGSTEVTTIYGDDGKAYLVLVPPADAPDAVLSYRIYKNNNSNLGDFVVSGKVNGKKSIAVPCPENVGEAGHYIIKAYAHKNLYADSAESTCTIETKPSTYFGNGGLVSVDDIMVWVDGRKASEYSSSPLQKTKGSVSLPLVATSASASNSSQDVITEGITWNWRILLAGNVSNTITPSSDNSSVVSFNSSSCNTDYTYVLEIKVTYGGREKIFCCNMKFTNP
ncbi:MAG: hypothetical protein IJM03_10710 [Treponema sp.]|nr:hypothetical protein [Treponema sp.]